MQKACIWAISWGYGTFRPPLTHSSNMHVQSSSGLDVWFFIGPYFMCVNSKGSGETAQMRRLGWDFAGRLCDKYHNLMSWLISFHPCTVCGNILIKCYHKKEPGTIAGSDVRPPGMQTVAGLILASGKTFFCWDLVMKKFLRPFFSRWCKKGSWQFLAKEWTLSTDKLSRRLAQERCG